MAGKTAVKRGKKKLRKYNGRKPGTENIDGQGFHTNPERINRKGRPPKLLHHINAELKERGFEPVTEGQIIEAYNIILQLPEAEIKKIASDKTKPYYLRKVIAYMGSNRGMEMFDRILDRSFGKAVMRASVDANVSAKPIPEAQGNQTELLQDAVSFLDPSDLAVINKDKVTDTE